MITSIIFSKDRAFQLDLTLKSIRKNFSLSSENIVIYDSSSEPHEQSYELLKKEYPEINFAKQSTEAIGGIFLDVTCSVREAKNSYICFFTDDDIVYRKVSFNADNLNMLKNLRDPEKNPVEFCCISLRMGLNTTYRRSENDGELYYDMIPETDKLEHFLLWNRTHIPCGGYWAYPLSVDGHIFHKERMFNFCRELLVLQDTNLFDWKHTPNELESKLQRFFFDLSSLMVSPLESCVVNSPNNRVQDSTANRHGDFFSCHQDKLLELFIQGKRLDLSKIVFEDIVCPHQEIDIMKGVS